MLVSLNEVYWHILTHTNLSNVDQNCRMMFLIKKKRVFDLIYYFRRNLNQNYFKLKMTPNASKTIAIVFYFKNLR